MTIKAIIFDMDGVLVEAKDWHYQALNQALNIYGYNISRQDHLSTYDGLPTRVKLDMLTKNSGLPIEFHPEINRLKQEFTIELFETLCKPNPIHLSTIQQLRKDGYLLGLASNSIRESVDIVMQKTQLGHFFDVILSNQDVSKPKPHPEIYLEAARKLHLDPTECLVLEDNINGINAAIAANTNILKINAISDVNYLNIINCINQYSACNTN